MRFVEICPSLWVNPEYVQTVEDHRGGVRLVMKDGEAFEVEGTAEEMVERLESAGRGGISLVKRSA